VAEELAAKAPSWSVDLRSVKPWTGHGDGLSGPHGSPALRGRSVAVGGVTAKWSRGGQRGFGLLDARRNGSTQGHAGPVSSNLWAGIADPRSIAAAARRLLRL